MPDTGVMVFGASHQNAEHTSQMQWFHLSQKAIVDQMSSRPGDSDHDLLLVQVWLWGCVLELLIGPVKELVITRYHIKSTLFHTS